MYVNSYQLHQEAIRRINTHHLEVNQQKLSAGFKEKPKRFATPVQKQIMHLFVNEELIFATKD